MRDARSGRRRLTLACVVVAFAASHSGRAADDVAAEAGKPRKRPAAAAADPFGDVVAEAVPPQAAVPLAQPAAPPPVVPADAPAEVIHPQVNMAGFTREYRAVPLDNAPADIAIRAALGRPLAGGWEFRETPLRDLVAHARTSLGVNVVLDERALEDAGIDPADIQVTARLSGMSVRAALRILLTPFDLACVAADEKLTVTTIEAAQERLVNVAYPLPRWAGFAGQADAQAAVDLIQSTVAADTWDVVGGMGSIRVVDAAGEPLLVVSQTGDVHDAVERMLAAIHGRSLAEFEAERPVLKVHRVADAASREDLTKKLKEICNATLGAEADPDAEVTALAASLTVRSKSPVFHALAAQVIAAVAGVEDRPPFPDGMNMNPFGP